MSKRRSLASHSLRRSLILVLAIALGLAAPIPLPASAKPSAPIPSTTKGVRPTVVLVHGAWADASSWSGTARRLQADGYKVVAPPNPLRGLAGDTAYLQSFLSTITGPVILAGHSYGGAVITDAATGNPNVKALVYVDAFAPDKGETLLQLVSAQPGSALAADPTTVFDLVPYPGAPAGDVDLYLKATKFHKVFAADLPSRRAAVLAATQRPLALGAIQSPSTAPAWKVVPSWYLIGTKDAVIPVAEQRAMAKRAGSHTREVAASHLSLISHPIAVEHLIQAADVATL